MTTAPSGRANDHRVEFLAGLPLFAGLAGDDLDRLARAARRVVASAGTLVMEEGGRNDGLHVVVRGELTVSRRDGETEHVLAILGPGDIAGEMSLVDDAPRSASVRARTEAELLVVGPDEFRRLIASSDSAALTIMRTIMARLRSTEGSLRQQAKLAALGTLAAGLAHELNNPASAIHRGVDHLRRALTSREEVFERLRLDAVPTGAALRPARETGAEEGTPGALVQSSADLNDREEAVEEWLASQGFRMSSLDAASLAAVGWTPESLAHALRDLPEATRALAAEGLAADAEVESILDEIESAAKSLTRIVRAVKGYTYLGEAPVQRVDLRQSLENTLTILRSKLNPGVHVVRRYDPEVREVEGFGSELSQLWTNLIDNAVDAMNGAGVLEIRTGSEGDHVVVEITDSGPGIAPEIRDRIFEPFVTTKPQGVGTGLGLHLSYTTVRKHGGRMSVESEPGRTTFRVVLPIHPSRGA